MDIDKILSISFLGFNHWGYVIVVLAAIFETIPILGIFVPGVVVVMAAGFLVKLGSMTIGFAVFSATLGSIIGDILGYYLGKTYGISFLKKYGKYFFIREKQLTEIKKVLNQHTGKSILAGRFAPLTRAITPLMAGFTNIPFGNFMFYNVISGLLWSASFVSLGYIFGQSYEVASQYIGKYVTIAFLISIGIIYIYRFVNKRRHIFAKYNLYTLIINIFSLYLFAKMVEDVLNMQVVTTFDIWLNTNISSLWNPTLNNIAIFITSIANPLNLLIYSTILLVALFVKKRWYHLVLLLTSMTFGGLPVELAKLLMHRDRPTNPLIVATGYSFPSGHATMATIFFALILYAFKDSFKHRILRLLFIFVMILSFLLIGFSRIYLSVHWFSDVVAGVALGIFWLTLFIIIFKFVRGIARRSLYIVGKIIQLYLTP